MKKKHYSGLLLSTLFLPVLATAADQSGSWYVGARAGAASTAETGQNYTNPRVQGIVSSNDSSQAKFASILVGRTFDASPLSVELEYQRQGTSDFQRNTVGICPASVCGSPLAFNGFNSVRVKSQALFVNLGYRIPLGSPAASVTLNGGVGMSRNTTSGNQIFTLPATPNAGLLQGERFRANSENSLAWNLGASFNYMLSKSTTLDVGYRYVNFGKFNMLSDGTLTPAFRNSESFGGTLVAHQFFTGLRYRFE
ncbi:outer membrane protein [Herbaspirillum robiniae]|nr:outer membrane beta-barrel protein [Herbaspirillum robiniae]